MFWNWSFVLIFPCNNDDPEGVLRGILLHNGIVQMFQCYVGGFLGHTPFWLPAFPPTPHHHVPLYSCCYAFLSTYDFSGSFFPKFKIRHFQNRDIKLYKVVLLVLCFPKISLKLCCR